MRALMTQKSCAVGMRNAIPGNHLKYITHWLAVIANRNSTFSIRHEGTHHERLVESSRMSYSLIHVRVALAASDVPSILDIPATDDIHMEDRNYDFAWSKPNNGIYTTQNSLQTCAWTSTLNKAKLCGSKFLYLDQLESCLPRQTFVS